MCILDMKFGISRVNTSVFEVKEINTLEELIEWVKEQEEEIIISIGESEYNNDNKLIYDHELEIYDGYRE